MQEFVDHGRSWIIALRLRKLRVNIRQFITLSVCLRVSHDFLRHCQMKLRNVAQYELKLYSLLPRKLSWTALRTQITEFYLDTGTHLASVKRQIEQKTFKTRSWSFLGS